MATVASLASDPAVAAIDAITIDPASSSQDDATNNTVQSVPSTTSQSNTQMKLTIVSSRITRARIKNHKDYKKDDEPMVKLEESDRVVMEQEEEPPRKRKRTDASSTGRKIDATPADNGTLELVQLKVEQKDTPAQLAPKLLIIRGITFRDGAFARTLDKLVVDATQILDPNFRLQLKRGKENPYGLTPGFTPYPYRRVPTPEACEEVHRILTEMHGEVKQPEKMPVASLEIAGCGEVPCVLDALLRTLISGNTLMAAADAAIKNLAQHYGLRQTGTGAGSIDWGKVRLSSHQELAQAIKVAGNGPKRSHHIKQVLDMVYEENLQRAKEQPSTGTATQNLLSLDHMHTMTKDEAMAKFVSYPGIGIKTAACVTLFCLRMPCFAVDTHVHKFCRWLGWVPKGADPDNCFRHGDFMVPGHLKYGLHQLFIRHGQQCFKCRKATKPGTKDWNEAPECPLEHLLNRIKDETGPKVKQPRKVKEVSSESEASDIDPDSKGAEGAEEVEEE
ncbi:hypothetical protein N0V88_003557 [Collariella sp. IMI 366227]|nr:hypothetical protein N0V88_003557 [Collariella sp. IMI 366227]